jgi:hypothetical protein
MEVVRIEKIKQMKTNEKRAKSHLLCEQPKCIKPRVRRNF